MNTIDILFAVAGSASTGVIVGVWIGLRSGTKRTRGLLSVMVNKMEHLRDESRLKVVRRYTAEIRGNYALKDELTKELHSEGKIFYAVQRTISDWCINNNEKNPFAL